MANITTERNGELVRGVFEILRDSPDGLQAAEALKRLEERVPPTPFEAQTYPKRPKERRYEKIVRFATIAPVKAGWLLKSNGTWQLTDAGLEALSKYPNPVAFFQAVGDLYDQWAKGQPSPQIESGEEGDEPSATTTYEEAQETATSQVREHLHQMYPYDFQNLIAGLLSAMGYYISWIAPPGPDGGIDIIAHQDPLGVSEPRIRVQAKRQQSKANVDQVRALIGLLGDRDVGIFVSLGGFTSDAESEARRERNRKVSTIDMDKLLDLWRKYYDNLKEDARQLLPLRAVHFIAPLE